MCVCDFVSLCEPECVWLCAAMFQIDFLCIDPAIRIAIHIPAPSRNDTPNQALSTHEQGIVPKPLDSFISFISPSSQQSLTN